MSVRIEKFVNGRWHQNCYIVGNDAREALIIDPGSMADKIVEILEHNDWRARAILNTHAHYDHVGAIVDLMDRFDLPFYMHGDDSDILQRANLYKLIFDSYEAVRIPQITHDLRDAPSVLEIGTFRCSWMATPGHTPGSVCFQFDDYLFAGDTLLPNAIGRTDLPGGNKEQLAESLKKIAALPGEMVVCAGHGDQTTLGVEFAPGGKLQNFIK